VDRYAKARDDDSLFQNLVQSPLRAGLLRFLNARSAERFDLASLMSTFGRMRLDVENCLRELVEFGVVRRLPGVTPTYLAQRPQRQDTAQQLHVFLERQAAVSSEDQAPSVQRFREMIGRDEKMLVVFEWIRTAAKSDISVLILGPTGSGKEVVARMIHELSRRGSENFQAVNCAALPDTLFESELFGYEKGAFTGAHDRKPGRLELADHGTLLLDEIGDLSLVAQAKLLSALDERRFERLGGQKAVEVDFRLISATNRPLDLCVRDGQFREDLFDRVNAFAIRLPSLRERPLDIPVLATRFLARYCASNGLPLDAKIFSAEAIEQFRRYRWPGNIRELENTVSRAALTAPGRLIRGSDVEFLHAQTTSSCGPEAPPRLPTLREAERTHIVRALAAAAWNKKEASRMLEISRGTLYRKILEYGLDPNMNIS
jgi:transcriptional regulator with GAF, ATPase, and Fis domain